MPYLLTGGGAKQLYCCFRASRPWGFIICKKVAWPRSLQKNDYFTRALTCTPPIDRYRYKFSCGTGTVDLAS